MRILRYQGLRVDTVMPCSHCACWEHLIKDELEYQKHIDYVHLNPLKHGLVIQVRDWPYSTFHREVGRGTI